MTENYKKNKQLEPDFFSQRINKIVSVYIILKYKYSLLKFD